MKTLAQQYQVLKNTIETIGRNCFFSMSSISEETIALVCEKLTLDFCKSLPKEFDYKVTYHQSELEVEIEANVKGENKPFLVTLSYIENAGLENCRFAKRLASYKESLNIEVLSENAQKLRLEKQEVAKEEEKQEVEEQEEVIQQVKEDLYSDILFENSEFNSFIENNCTPILDFEFDSDNNIYIYDEGITAFEGQIFSKTLFRDIIKLGMYIERRNQLNKK